MEPKSYTHSKTMWVAAALAALGVVQTQIPDLSIPADYQGYVTVAVGAIIAFLRVVTSQPVKL